MTTIITLHVEYSWSSSVGGLSNLSGCRVGERVEYESLPFPSPPFKAGISPPNPTELDVAHGAFGGLQDNHSTDGPFVQPYTSATVTATQTERYRCTCKENNAWIQFAGPWTIVRTVTQRGDGKWKFTITKDGNSATIDPLPSDDLDGLMAWFLRFDQFHRVDLRPSVLGFPIQLRAGH